MKPEAAEWIDKAEGDWKVAQREVRRKSRFDKDLSLW